MHSDSQQSVQFDPNSHDQRAIFAGAARDASGINLRHGACVVVNNAGDILSIQDSRSVDRDILARQKNIVIQDRPDWLIIPGLVNAHAHLDLTHVGRVPYPGSFIDWITQIRGLRHEDDDALRHSVEEGVARARRGGTALIGDIAGMESPIPVEVLASSDLGGVSFLEFFGRASLDPEVLSRVRRTIREVESAARGCRIGLQPHAPYSVDLDLYQDAVGLAASENRLLSTHLAETPEETELIHDGTGPFATFLASIGKFDRAWYPPTNRHPVDHLAPVLEDATARGTRFVIAHANYVEDAHIDIFRDTGTTIAYCPRASAYFKHRNHRYREMLDRGVNVALGTDSLLCLDADADERLSILDEMRLLYRRDDTDPEILLQMATVNGARALGFDASEVTLSAGSSRGLLGIPVDFTSPVDPLIQALASNTAPELHWVT